MMRLGYLVAVAVLLSAGAGLAQDTGKTVTKTRKATTLAPTLQPGVRLPSSYTPTGGNGTLGAATKPGWNTNASRPPGPGGGGGAQTSKQSFENTGGDSVGTVKGTAPPGWKQNSGPASTAPSGGTGWTKYRNPHAVSPANATAGGSGGTQTSKQSFENTGGDSVGTVKGTVPPGWKQNAATPTP
jgi:hypothetical protein